MRVCTAHCVSEKQHNATATATATAKALAMCVHTRALYACVCNKRCAQGRVHQRVTYTRTWRRRILLILHALAALVDSASYESIRRAFWSAALHKCMLCMHLCMQSARVNMLASRLLQSALPCAHSHSILSSASPLSTTHCYCSNLCQPQRAPDCALHSRLFTFLASFCNLIPFPLTLALFPFYFDSLRFMLLNFLPIVRYYHLSFQHARKLRNDSRVTDFHE